MQSKQLNNLENNSMVSTQTTDKCHRCKTRVPLTKEEIDQIAIKCLASPAVDRGWNRNLARAIEQAHGIKDA